MDAVMTRSLVEQQHNANLESHPASLSFMMNAGVGRTGIDGRHALAFFIKIKG